MFTITPEKQAILDRISAALQYMHDDPVEAEKDQPWIARILIDILENLDFDDISIYQVQTIVALLGPTFSRSLGGGGGQDLPADPPTLYAV